MSLQNGFSFEKRYILKAHTPLIHFQHDQSGATLRATEVKPKLDDFLRNKLKERTIPASWFVKETKAFNYKLHIEAHGPKKEVELGRRSDNNAYDIYYGRSKGILGDACITVICMIRELRDIIDKYIGEFFIVTNFGSMQSKGFGSYTVTSGQSEAQSYNPKEISKLLRAFYHSEKCYTFAGGPFPFSRIKIIYSIMKSGVNLGEHQRSLLFLYMHKEKEIGNEKAWLKSNGAPTNVGKHCNQWHRNDASHPPYYVRALLGLGDHIDFIKDLRNRRDKMRFKISHNKGRNEDKIERLESPIFFKIIDGNVYYIAKRINKEILGKDFLFTDVTDKRNRLRIGTLSVPDAKNNVTEDFADEFLKYCFDELNNGALQKFEQTRSVTIKEV